MNYFISLAVNIPEYIVFIVAIIIAVRRFKKDREHSIVAILCFTLFLATYIAFPIINEYLMEQAYLNRTSDGSFSAPDTRLLNIVGKFINISLWVGILFLVFGWRKIDEKEI